MQIALSIVQVVCSLLLIAIILFQQGSKSNMGVVTGGSSDTFLSRNKNKTRDARLARFTVSIGALFLLSTIAINVL